MLANNVPHNLPLQHHFFSSTVIDDMADAPTPSAASAPTQQPANTPNRGSTSAHRRGRRGRARAGPSQGRGTPRERGAHAQSLQGPFVRTDASAEAVADISAQARASSPRPSNEAGSRGSRARGGNPGRGRRGRGGRTGRAVASQMAPRRAFGGHLTSTTPQDAPSLSGNAPEFVPGQPVEQTTETISPKKHRAHSQGLMKSHATDLTTRIHEDINNGQHECTICSSEVTRTSRIWACKLCWTVTHYQCTKKWFYTSVKVSAQPQGANPEDAEMKWRCPGCNSVMTEEPDSYHCWCGKEPNPRSVTGLPPHSCGQTCSKPRGKCPHPCYLQCHAGPCPPCHLKGPEQACFCGKTTFQRACTDPGYDDGYSCDELCDDILPCGEHVCRQKCHPGVCGECEMMVPSSCYCGREHKEVPCGERDTKESYNVGDGTVGNGMSPGTWFQGSFTCHASCGRNFDCGVHVCQKSCHPLDEKPAHCPWSPDMVTHCPCGKTPLEEISPEPRQSCSDKISHCAKACGKPLPCGHQCQDPCHTGDCKPCFQKTDITCRCGRNTMHTTCHGVPQNEVMSPECPRLCKVLKNCGRHQCDSRCCPGEKRAVKRQANKRKTGVDEDVEGEHICTRICGRLLKCGKHFCQQLCHKGPCPGCLEAVFSEITCSCGRTTLYPPQPCGTTVPQCRFNCTRSRACGHPQVEHQCHPDDVECPKCPFLVEKPCFCGKEYLANQPCWFEKPRCGKPCGKRLKCGTHFCKQVCHRGPCEDAAVPGSRCSQPCGKPRESCGHEDLDPCHAPFDCKEDKSCQAETFLTCECQRRKQKVKCLSTRSEPKGPPRESPKCDDECLRQKRNRQLAEAFNIDPDHTDDHIPYQDATLIFFRDNTEWALQQEGRFREFAESNARHLRFEPMKPAQRAFLHMLAEDYGMESDSQDPEPYRHVTLLKGSLFISAPHKTLLQSLRLWKKAAKAASASRPASPPGGLTNKAALPPYNALLLTRAKFGLTSEELDSALATDLTTASASTNNSLTFTTSFLPSSEEVLIKATAKTTIANIASGTLNPSQVESLLTNLKSKILKAVSTSGLAAGVLLCHVAAAAAAPSNTTTENDNPALSSSLNTTNIIRREGTRGGASSGGPGGWSTVASRAAARPRMWAPASPVVEVKPNGFVALRKLGTLKKKQPSASSSSATSGSGAPANTNTTIEVDDGSVAESTTAPAVGAEETMGAVMNPAEEDKDNKAVE